MATHFILSLKSFLFVFLKTLIFKWFQLFLFIYKTRLIANNQQEQLDAYEHISSNDIFFYLIREKLLLRTMFFSFVS